MIRKKPMPSSLEQEFKKNGLEPILEKEDFKNRLTFKLVLIYIMKRT